MGSDFESDDDSDCEDGCEEAYDDEGSLSGDLNHINDDERRPITQSAGKFQSSKSSTLYSASQRTHSQSTTTLTSSKAKKGSVQGVKKTFSLPLDRSSFSTFIHEEAFADEEGYPLLPNGNTVYVREEGQKNPTNWGTFGFAYTTSGGGIKEGSEWRTVRFSCLGVIVCLSHQCDYLGSPHTSSARSAEWHSKYVGFFYLVLLPLRFLMIFWFWFF